MKEEQDMDIKCPHCGEPMDHDELHGLKTPDAFERAIPYSEAVAKWQKYGCGLFDWAWNNKPLAKCSRAVVDGEGALRARVAHELMGDDMDGVASMLDDIY